MGSVNARKRKKKQQHEPVQKQNHDPDRCLMTLVEAQQQYTQMITAIPSWPCRRHKNNIDHINGRTITLLDQALGQWARISTMQDADAWYKDAVPEVAKQETWHVVFMSDKSKQLQARPHLNLLND
ncbi:hypothetical protein VTN49DRAFT_7833 [Thermomyces lanuginosus]|uniref:uncharacterized protein n=1 Tax=Thermomyces lanuginosus TaxID=5541 RepID=UPI0037427D35